MTIEMHDVDPPALLLEHFPKTVKGRRPQHSHLRGQPMLLDQLDQWARHRAIANVTLEGPTDNQIVEKFLQVPGQLFEQLLFTASRPARWRRHMPQGPAKTSVSWNSLLAQVRRHRRRKIGRKGSQ